MTRKKIGGQGKKLKNSKKKKRRRSNEK